MSYLQIPQASSDQSFNNSKIWLDDALTLNHGHNESTFDSATRVIIHMMKFYNDSFVEAWKRRGMAIAQPMMTTQYVAMLSSLGISGKKELELAKYLWQHLGKGFVPTWKDDGCLQRDMVPSKLTANRGNMRKEKEQRKCIGWKRI